MSVRAHVKVAFRLFFSDAYLFNSFLVRRIILIWCFISIYFVAFAAVANKQQQQPNIYLILNNFRRYINKSFKFCKYVYICEDKHRKYNFIKRNSINVLVQTQLFRYPILIKLKKKELIILNTSLFFVGKKQIDVFCYYLFLDKVQHSDGSIFGLTKVQWFFFGVCVLCLGNLCVNLGFIVFKRS